MKRLFFIIGLFILCTTGYAEIFPQSEGTIRIMCYNIRNARGMDNFVDYQRIADVILRTNPAVVALQELDSVTNRSRQVDVLRYLAALTGMYAVYGPAIEFDGGLYGVGTLSRERPLSWQNIPLPGREEERTLLLVEFEHFVLANTHFSLNAEDRMTSVEIVNRAAKQFDKPVILAGDINARPDSPVMHAFMENWQILSDPSQYTFPSDNPNRTIDYIMGFTVAGHTFTVYQAQVLNEPVASDHLPLFVDVRINQ